MSKINCKYCGEELDPRGLTSHMIHKHPDMYFQEKVDRGEIKVNPVPVQKCPACGGALRYLRQDKSDEYKAIAAKYKMICTECEEMV